jgi:hypothetical protein
MRAETAQEYRQRVARAGGHGRAQKLTPKERSESARKAVKARWAKADKLIREMKAAEKEALRLVRSQRSKQTNLSEK